MVDTLEVVFGSSAQGERETRLRESLTAAGLHGHLYFSYPVYEAVDDITRSDALLTCAEHGVVMFDLTAPPFDPANPDAWKDVIISRQDELYRNLSAKMLSNKDLMNGRSLGFDINIVTFLPEIPEIEFPGHVFLADAQNVIATVQHFPPLPQKFERPLNATIQRVSTIKPSRRRENVSSDHTYGGKLRAIEANVANLDAWQKKGAITYPEGPQRIRGLAGSGKTIVLALKAAYLHAIHPEWDIVVTYYSRSLRQQFKDLIRRFMFEHKKDEPNWEKLKIMHSWGGRSEEGVYSEIARNFGIEPVTWAEANRRFGDLSFKGVCDEVEAAISQVANPTPMYDAVLIDEAQDLPVSFFRMVYAMTRAPKRVIWAYDELQNLGEYSMPNVADLFGRDSDGHPLVSLENLPNRPQHDIILPVCYRNTPWALSTAHGLGFGVYRKVIGNEPSPLVQMFDDPSLWGEIGYEVANGSTQPGHAVVLRRRPECSPDFFSDPAKRLIQPDEAVQFQVFEDINQQAAWIASEISRDLGERELQHRDILIILPNAWTSKSNAGVLTAALRQYNIPAHLAGVTSSQDEMFVERSIAITHIYRAKGNEAAMVYVVNSHECYTGFQLAKKRNTLFTAITRSRAWVRVCGVGPSMAALREEYQAVLNANYGLAFRYPTAEEISRMMRIHRDRSPNEQKKLSQGIEGFTEILDLIQRGELAPDQLPPDLLDKLRKIIGNQPDGSQ